MPGTGFNGCGPLPSMPASGLANGFHPGPPHPAEAHEEGELALAPQFEHGLDHESEHEPDHEPEHGAIAPPRLDPMLPPLEVPPPVPPWQADRRESRALVPVQPSVRVGISPWVFIAATAVNTIVAAVLAIVITLGVAKRDAAPAETERMAAAAVKPMAEPHSEPLVLRPVELLPVGSPSDPLRLEALKPTRLPLQIRPEEAMQESYILLLSGLPANAAITGAQRMGADSWLLAPGTLERIEIMLPEWAASVIEVGVELRLTNGAVAAQSKLWLAVPPPAVPAGDKLDETALRELVRNGDQLLSRGDVAAARAIYERAAAAGSAQAAFALGSTYDQRRLWSLGVFGMVGDKERARQWYARADQLGHPDAKARIAALKER